MRILALPITGLVTWASNSISLLQYPHFLKGYNHAIEYFSPKVVVRLKQGDTYKRTLGFCLPQGKCLINVDTMSIATLYCWCIGTAWHTVVTQFILAEVTELRREPPC